MTPIASARAAASPSQPLTIAWFRRDLRLRDNPALHAAAAAGPVLPIYILDDGNAADWKMGGASRWWLHHSLHSLNASLSGSLWIRKGDAARELAKLCSAFPVRKVLWNRCYEPWHLRQDRQVADALDRDGIASESCNSALLREPWETGKADGTPYGVFTPFHRNLLALLARAPPDAPLPEPGKLVLAQCSQVPQAADRIERLKLLPRVPWDAGWEQRVTPGEAAAWERLRAFLRDGIADYHSARDYLARQATSALSAHLHFGEIGPRQIWHEVRSADAGEGASAYLRQLCWREFSYHLLYHFPRMASENLRPGFERFPWRDDAESLQRWQRGATGIPLVDAGMRELRCTGAMHNRARMVAGSFLTKNLMIHWLAGARWFWDCLVDADLASNSFGWQWIAGCGADAAPYFRIFNPAAQSRKFDPEGRYLRRWLPELRRLSDRHIHAPWEAGAEALRKAGVRLGGDYPAPVVDLRESRERALAAWQALRGG